MQIAGSCGAARGKWGSRLALELALLRRGLAAAAATQCRGFRAIALVFGAVRSIHRAAPRFSTSKGGRLRQAERVAFKNARQGHVYELHSKEEGKLAGSTPHSRPRLPASPPRPGRNQAEGWAGEG